MRDSQIDDAEWMLIAVAARCRLEARYAGSTPARTLTEAHEGAAYALTRVLVDLAQEYGNPHGSPETMRAVVALSEPLLERAEYHCVEATSEHPGPFGKGDWRASSTAGVYCEAATLAEEMAAAEHAVFSFLGARFPEARTFWEKMRFATSILGDRVLRAVGWRGDEDADLETQHRAELEATAAADRAAEMTLAPRERSVPALQLRQTPVVLLDSEAAVMFPHPVSELERLVLRAAAREAAGVVQREDDEGVRLECRSREDSGFVAQHIASRLGVGTLVRGDPQERAVAAGRQPEVARRLAGDKGREGGRGRGR